MRRTGAFRKPNAGGIKARLKHIVIFLVITAAIFVLVFC